MNSHRTHTYKSSNNNNNNNTQKKNIGRNGRNELRVQKMKIVRNRNRTKAKDPRTVTKTHPHSETIIKRILKVPPYMCSFIVSLSKQLLYLRAFTNRNGFQRLFWTNRRFIIESHTLVQSAILFDSIWMLMDIDLSSVIYVISFWVHFFLCRSCRCCYWCFRNGIDSKSV